jgi:hypothetical protein
MGKPTWWFKTLEEASELQTEPSSIEYLKVGTGETYVHTHGTAFWNNQTGKLDVEALKRCDVTHWR